MNLALQVVRPVAGGIRAHVIDLANGLQRQDWAVALAGPRQFLGSLPAALESGKCIHFELDIKSVGSPGDLGAALRLAALVRRHPEISILHSHGIRAAMIASLAARVCTPSSIATFHNVVPDTRVSQLLMRGLLPSFDAVIAVSDAVASSLYKVTGSNSAQVIPNGIDTQRFHITDRLAARAKLRLNPAAHIVLIMARLSVEKGVDLALRVADCMPDALFVVVGDGPERAKLEASAPSNVLFMGHRMDPETLISSADAVFVPSRSEGFGLVALESMAAGVPVVAARTGGLEVIVGAGRGILVEPGDILGSVRALQYVRKYPDASQIMTQSAYAYARGAGSMELMVTRTRSVYEEVVLRHG